MGYNSDGKLTNSAGLTIAGTLDQGQQSQDDAKYRQPTEEAWQACGGCRFFLRDPAGAELGTCQAVSGAIAWFGTCIYYVSASDAVFEAFQQAAQAFAAPVFMRAVETSKSRRLKPAVVTKHKDGSQSRFIPIIKVDDMEHIIYGIVYEPDVEDAHGEFARKTTIRKAAHDFLSEFGEVNLMHTVPLGKRQVSVIESFIAPVSFEVNGDFIQKGSWVLAAKVHDEDIWELIVSGELTGWSLEGHAEYGEEVERIEPEAASA